MRVSETSSSILRRIGRSKLREISALKPRMEEFKSRAKDMPQPIDFFKAINGAQGLSVIAEIKRASPSAGLIAEGFDPEAMANSYRNAGADAVSVLTDVEYFKGSIECLVKAKAKLGGIPALRKDFILDEVQVHEARAAGADSFLLIAAMLEGDELKRLLDLGRSIGMEALVESHDIEDLDKSVSAGARILGFNNRNLNDFSVDLAVSETLADAMPEASVAIAESGIKTPADARRVFDAGCKGILVGESLMRKGFAGCGELLSAFKEACRG